MRMAHITINFTKKATQFPSGFFYLFFVPYVPLLHNQKIRNFMKHTIRICSAILVPLLLASEHTQCSSTKNKSKNSQGTSRMNRTKTNSGLEYQILQPGSGESPKMGKQVTVHYTGWLDVDGQPGKKFDSSVDRGRPFSFIIGVGQVISGWDEGVASMKVGEERKLFITSKLGFVER